MRPQARQARCDTGIEQRRVLRDNDDMLFGRRVERVSIANPCRENWTAMSGGAERFCAVCNRSVHDLSALTSRQAAALFANNAGKLCGRITYDQRGNPIFAKERSPINRLMQISLLSASSVASAAAAPSCELKVRVVDPLGAPVPKANVEISNAAAGTVSSAASNDPGEWISRIDPGVYSLRVGSPGLVPFQQDVTCKLSETVSVSASLHLAALMGEVVDVTPKPFLNRLAALFRRH